MAEANAQRDQAHRGSPCRGLPPPGAGDAKGIAVADQIVARAREAADQDYARMLAELKREVGRLVVQTTAMVVGKILTPEDQRRLVEETAKELTTQ